MNKVFVCLTLIVDLLAIAQCCFGQTQPLRAEIKKHTIDDLSALLPEGYAYKGIGQKLQQLLEQNLKSGKYDIYNYTQEFSTAIRNYLRSLSRAKYLPLNYIPDIQSPHMTQITTS